MWAGGDLLRAVEWAQDDWRGETQGKDQDLTAGVASPVEFQRLSFPRGRLFMGDRDPNSVT